MNNQTEQTEKAIKKFNEVREYILENHSTHMEFRDYEYFVTIVGKTHLKYYTDCDEEGEALSYYETASNKSAQEIYLEIDIEDYHDELDKLLEIIKKGEKKW